MRRIVRWATFATVLLVPACATGSSAEDPFGPSGRSGPQSIGLFVENDNAEDVVISVVSADGVQMAATVAPQTSQTFRVEWRRPRDLRVRIEILAGPRYTTNTLGGVQPGERVELWVRRDVERSVIRRR